MGIEKYVKGVFGQAENNDPNKIEKANINLDESVFQTERDKFEAIANLIGENGDKIVGLQQAELEKRKQELTEGLRKLKAIERADFISRRDEMVFKFEKMISLIDEELNTSFRQAA